ncbi:tetratricopeptide repeat protein [Streptomyces sp. AcH 505]|uniref:tetratricopeptide repeat protein n=1 Tax=Streptomyces sp. AcH 505 TaxID=352211 RepID=UPI0005AB004D
MVIDGADDDVLPGQHSRPSVRNELVDVVAGVVVQAGSITGGVHFHAVPHNVPVPRQLPSAPRVFVGRSAELAELTGVLDKAAAGDSTVLISAVAGSGGIGKTCLALQWAHQHADVFPDGQLFVDLQGFWPTSAPLDPAVALRGFLEALGVESGRMPVDLDGRVALYRSLAAGRRMLIVLDNARNTEQVAKLLPGSPTCTVVVTSRNHMPGLVARHGARPLALDVLDAQAARAIFAEHIGASRLEAEPEAAAELVALCGGLPLALSIVGARALIRSQLSLAALASEIRHAATRLAALDDTDGAASVPVVLSWSYAALQSEQSDAIELFALAPGPDLGLTAAAVLVEQRVRETIPLLRALEQLSLLQQVTPGRYRMHDLIRLHAVDRARHRQAQVKRDDALRRIVDFYAHTTFEARLLLDPHGTPITMGEAPGGDRQSLLSEADAVAWFKAELPCLRASQELALERGWHAPVWRLAWALHTYQWREGYVGEQAVAWTLALTAAQHAGEVDIQIRAHRALADLASRAGSYDDALTHLRQGLAIAEEHHDDVGRGHLHHTFAWLCEQRGEPESALDHAIEALKLFRVNAQPIWEAHGLNQVGWYQALLHHYGEARANCEEALALCRRLQHHEAEAATLDSLGYIAQHTGDPASSVRHYSQALELFRALGNAYEEADTLEHLGQAYREGDREADASAAWRSARDLYESQGRTAQARHLDGKLATLETSSGLVPLRREDDAG